MSKKYKVLILPAGSGMAVAAIKSLKKDSSIETVSADSNRLAPGLYLSDKSFVVPRFDDSDFFDSLKKIIVDESIDLVIPALDTVLLSFSEKNSFFESLGTKLMSCSPETIRITRDKWLTYNKLRTKVPFPSSFVNKKHINIGFPLFIKPRAGSGSINTFKCENELELDFFLNKFDNMIIQEFLPGKEFTVDCLCDLNGKFLCCMSRERLEIKAGISVKGKIVKSDTLELLAKNIASSMEFKGPFFFQVKEDINRNPKILEINARISGSMSLSSFSIGNIYSLAIRSFLGEKITIPEIKPNVFLIRYFEDMFFEEKDLK